MEGRTDGRTDTCSKKIIYYILEYEMLKSFLSVVRFSALHQIHYGCKILRVIVN